MTGRTQLGGRTGRRPSSLAAALGAALAVAASVAVTVLVAASPADASSYRYWSYWLGGDGGWAFSAQGAARVPADGTVDGWRFAVSPATGSSTPPGTSSDFAQLCQGTPASQGKKRVGVVIDYGTAADAPPGEVAPDGPVGACVLVDPGATGYEVLLAVPTTLRVEQGLVCGISGYPATGCGEPVADSSRSPSTSGAGTGTTGGTPGAADPSRSPGDSGGSAAPPAPGTATPPATPRATATKAQPPDPAPTSRDVADAASPLAAPASPPAPAGPGSPLPLVLGLAVTAGLAGGSAIVARRRRS